MLAIPAAVQLLIINRSHEDGTVRKSAVSAAIPTYSSGWAESMLVGVTTRPWDVTRSAFALLQSLHWLSQGSLNSPFASYQRQARQSRLHRQTFLMESQLYRLLQLLEPGEIEMARKFPMETSTLMRSHCPTESHVSAPPFSPLLCFNDSLDKGVLEVQERS